MIVIPMAGLSKRFTDAGYKKPKYMLDLHGRSVFWYSVSSFKYYFKKEKFVFVIRDVLGTKQFVEESCLEMGISDFEIVVLHRDTKGQAETVFLGLHQIGAFAKDPVSIFNIDTFRPGFRHPEEKILESDGYLEVFRGEGEHWSFIEPDPEMPNYSVKRTTEKKRISDYCSTGFYHFASGELFAHVYACEIEKRAQDLPEYYVAPLYNHAIREGKLISYIEISRDQLLFCGVPNEFQALSKMNQEQLLSLYS